MATKLESLIVRESSETVDDRNILVALTEDQRISFRLKGMKSGSVSILIKELYEQLVASPSGVGKTMKLPKPGSTVQMESDPLSVLNRLRTINATTPGKAEFVARIDEVLVQFKESLKQK